MRAMVVWSLMAAGALSAVIVRGGQRQKAPPEPTRLIASIQGPALYKAYCAVCHGPNGAGNGPMANSLKVQPADLSRIVIEVRGMITSLRHLVLFLKPATASKCRDQDRIDPGVGPRRS